MLIRAYTWQKEQIQLCPHIKVKGEETDEEFPSLEYKEDVELYCDVCKKIINLTIAVN